VKVRDLAATAAGSPVATGLIRLLELADRPRPSTLTVLTYHRIAEPGDEPDLDPALISATPRDFAQQIAQVAAHRPTISLDDLLRVRRGEALLPTGAVMITFDDAYRDFAEHAWPVLRRHGVPAVLFVPTAYPDSPGPGFWWDRLHRAFAHTNRRTPLSTPAGGLPLATAAERAGSFRLLRDRLKSTPHAKAMAAVDQALQELEVPDDGCRVLGWDGLRSLARDGVALAPHTRTHPLLDQLPADQAREELSGSLADLEREIGPTPRAFAYPAGGHDAKVLEILAEEGFEAAFTTARGRNDLSRADWLALSRINVGRRTSLTVLRAQLLSGLGSPGWRPRLPVRGQA